MDSPPLDWVEHVSRMVESPFAWAILAAVVVIALAWSPLAKVLTNLAAKRAEKDKE